MAQQPIVYDAAQDLVDQLVGLKSDDATYAVRHQRDKVAAATRAAMTRCSTRPARPDPGRAPAGRAVCAPDARPELAAHYRQRAIDADASPPISRSPKPASRRTPPTRV